MKTKKIKNNEFILELLPVRIGYTIENEYFVRKGTSNNTSQRYAIEYKIFNCDIAYNTSKQLKDWKYILNNLNNYEWVKPYLTSSTQRANPI